MPNKLDQENSKYDVRNKTPYPTISFTQEETGENMTVNAGSTEKATAEIKQYTDFFKSRLFRANIRETYSFMEYLIATNKDWRYEFIKSVARLIYEDYNSDSDKELIADKIIEENRLLSIKRFARNIIRYEVDY